MNRILTHGLAESGGSLGAPVRGCASAAQSLGSERRSDHVLQHSRSGVQAARGWAPPLPRGFSRGWLVGVQTGGAPLGRILDGVLTVCDQLGRRMEVPARSFLNPAASG